MVIYNTVVVYDVYVIAESPEAAREAALANIRDGEQPLPPSEQVALEVRAEREIRAAWAEEGPLVGNDVSDADFAKLKGKKMTEIYAMLHKKPEKTEAAPAKNGKSTQPTATK
jgi:D-aminopeptidase